MKYREGSRMRHIFVINPISFHTKADLDTIYLDADLLPYPHGGLGNGDKPERADDKLDSAVYQFP